MYQDDDAWVAIDASPEEAIELGRSHDTHYNATLGPPRFHDDRPDLDRLLPHGLAGQALTVAGYEPTPLHRDGYLGTGARVAVLDSGGPAGSLDVVGNDGRDRYGHGTFVASIISGAYQDTEYGPMYGNAPMADLRHVKVLDDEGNTTIDTVVRGLALVEREVDWAPGTGGPVIVNMSLGRSEACTGDCPLCVKMSAMRESGYVFVVPTGNGGPVHCPAASPASYTVGSMYLDVFEDDAGLGLKPGPMADFTSRGGGRPHVLAGGGSGIKSGPKQWVVGPSAGALRAEGDGKWAMERGTSYAAPMVTGLLACMQEAGVPMSRVHRYVRA